MRTIWMCAVSVWLMVCITACKPQKKSFNESFVEVSSENPSYFCLSNGDPYLAIGLNMVHSYNNMELMERWIKNLSENGGNFIRIWLGHDMFDYEKVYGQVNAEQIAKVDRVLELAGKYGIKVKMCLENFRQIAPSIPPNESSSYYKTAYHIENGGPFVNMPDYMADERGQKVFLDRAKFFKNRYGDDPRIFAWELWNEMNAIWIENKPDVIKWNAEVIPKVQEVFPKNLITQSLGSFDKQRSFSDYEGVMKISENDVLQVHRYIDEGADLPICQAPMDVLAVDAIQILQSYGIQKPILLAETGGVKPRHSGPHPGYEKDHEGTILHDLLFAPYFAGAAGPGHVWHWDVYVDRNNLWYHFRRFSNAVGDINPIKEDFKPLRADQSNFRVYILKGKNHSLVWLRDTKSNWHTELIEGIEPQLYKNVSLILNEVFKNSKIYNVKIYDPWADQWSDAKASASVTLPDFKRSLVVRIKH